MALLLMRIAAGLFLAATIATGLHIVRPSEKAERRLLWIVACGLLVQAFAIGARAIELSAFPLADVHDALGVFGFILGLIAIIVSFRGGVPQVTWLSTPLVTLLVVISALFDHTPNAAESLRSPLLSVHISLALLGDAAFVIAGVVATVFLIHERRLKKKRRKKKDLKKEWNSSTAMDQLPALEALDKVSVSLFKIGFPLMTLGIITGMIYGKQVLDTYWTWDARNTVSALVWVLYAGMLHARLVIGWRGRKAALLTVAGVIVILLTFVGLGLASSGGLHGAKEFS